MTHANPRDLSFLERKIATRPAKQEGCTCMHGILRTAVRAAVAYAAFHTNSALSSRCLSAARWDISAAYPHVQDLASSGAPRQADHLAQGPHKHADVLTQ